MFDPYGDFKLLPPDPDPDETQDWIASLDALTEEVGRERAQFVLYKLLKRARQLHIGLPPLTQTRYINTISPEQEPPFPGDEEMEKRIRRLVRWNAAAMVLRANKASPGIGGHLATFASATSLYEVGLNHFFRGKDAEGMGDQVYYQGHAAPGMYARAFLEGRLSESQLDHFRREIVPGQGLSSYPHPRLMPDFWEFPTVSMGLSPLAAIYQARFNGRARVAGLAQHRRPRGVGQPRLRGQLQPAAARRTGAWQRQDRAGAGGRLPRRRLERDQGHLGPRVGRAAGARSRRRARPAHGRRRRRRVAEVLGRARLVHA
jgi:pyruvate dehydrogenase E1 component